VTSGNLFLEDVSREREPHCSSVSKPKQRTLWDNESMVLAIEAVKDRRWE